MSLKAAFGREHSEALFIRASVACKWFGPGAYWRDAKSNISYV